MLNVLQSQITAEGVEAVLGKIGTERVTRMTVKVIAADELGIAYRERSGGDYTEGVVFRPWTRIAYLAVESLKEADVGAWIAAMKGA